MNNSTFSINIKVIMVASALGLMSLPVVSWAGGGGGSGGGSTTGPSVSISINGVPGMATNGAVSNISYNQGSYSGTFNGISVSFNRSTGAWEGTVHHDGDGGGGLIPNTICSNCTYVPPLTPYLPPSNPSNLSHVCSADGSSVTLRWNASNYLSYSPSQKDDMFSLNWLRSVLVHVAHAGGGGGGDAGADSGGSYNINYGGSYDNPQDIGPRRPGLGHAPILYQVMVDQSGSYTNPIYSSETSGTSVGTAVTPGVNYAWRVRACVGGACGNWQNSSFRCAPAPKVDLTANPSTVRYNNPSTLTWTSEWTAPTCQAQFGWSGNRPNQNTSGESTGDLVSNTNYRLICPAQYDFPSAIDDATVSVVSCVNGAKASVSKDLVRKGEMVTFTYNTGAANPSQCVLKAGTAVLVDGLPDNGDTSASCSDGSTSADRTYSYEVNGEVDVTFECEGQVIDTLRIKVLPEFQET